MKKTKDTETGDADSDPEIESFVINTARWTSDLQDDNMTSVSFTSEVVAHKIRAVKDDLTLQLVNLCEIMHEFKNDQTSRLHKETTPFKTTGWSWGSGSRFINNQVCF